MGERTELDVIIDRLKSLSNSKTKPKKKQDATRPQFSSGGFRALNRKKKLKFSKQQRTEAEKKRNDQQRKRLARIPVMG
tara:strand:- start:7 stop:243 length:237 start_codon:yes stop_codon:yes gene_type:complete